MEDGHQPQQDGGQHPTEASPPPRSPPPPPEPRAVDDKAALTAASVAADEQRKSDEPLKLKDEKWDIHSISALAAMRMFAAALEGLAEATGDIPPTPPVSRPPTPHQNQNQNAAAGAAADQDPDDRKPSFNIGSPEAHPSEPMSLHAHQPHTTIPTTSIPDLDLAAAHAAIARRFFSKTAPPFSLSDWLLRLHTHCPHSPAVYLAAAAFVHRLCVSDLVVPATRRTIHRLALASIRVATKALEDNKWTQERMARMGGVTKLSLMKMEMTLCYLLDFELWIDEGVLRRRMWLLQQAGAQGMGARGKLGEDFRLRLPMRRRVGVAG